jgi:hypothetical protein
MKTRKDFQADAAYYALLAGREGSMVRLVIEAVDRSHATYSDELAARLRQGAASAWRRAEMAVANGWEVRR